MQYRCGWSGVFVLVVRDDRTGFYIMIIIPIRSKSVTISLSVSHKRSHYYICYSTSRRRSRLHNKLDTFPYIYTYYISIMEMRRAANSAMIGVTATPDLRKLPWCVTGCDNRKEEGKGEGDVNFRMDKASAITHLMVHTTRYPTIAYQHPQYKQHTYIHACMHCDLPKIRSWFAV